MILLAAVLALFGQDRPEKAFAQATFGKPEGQDDVQKRVEAFLREKKHWIAAFKTVEEKVAPLPEKFPLEVTFDLQGQNPSTGGAGSGKPFVKFSLTRLGDYQSKIDAIEKQRKDLAKEGKRITFKIPALKFEKLITMEVAKIVLEPLEVSEWLRVGWAVWAADEPNFMAGLAQNGKKVEDIEAPPAEPQDIYGRGHAFWKWMESKGAARKASKALVAGGDWKKSLEEAAGMPWDALKAAELEWSAKEIRRLASK